MTSEGNSFVKLGIICLIVCLMVFSAAPQIAPMSSAVLKLPICSQAKNMADAAREFGFFPVNSGISFTLLTTYNASFFISLGKLSLEQNRSFTKKIVSFFNLDLT